MEQALVISLVNLGVGGIVSYLVLQWKRADDLAWAAERKATAEAHTKEIREEKERHAAELKEVLDRSMAIQEKTLDAMTLSTSAMLSMKQTAEGLVSLTLIEKRLEKIEAATTKVADGTPRQTS